MKLGKDEVLMVCYKFCSFRLDLPRGGSWAGPNQVTGGVLHQRTSSDRKATATIRIQSSDQEANGKKWGFWVHFDVKF